MLKEILENNDNKVSGMFDDMFGNVMQDIEEITQMVAKAKKDKDEKKLSQLAKSVQKIKK